MTHKNWGRARVLLQDIVTGRQTLASDWTENMILDSGLNQMANNGSSQVGLAGLFSFMQIGSGTTPNSFNTGGATLTQTGNTVTSSTAFFTSAMIGAILKYGASGSAGAEQYISGIGGGGLTATVSGPGMTVGTLTAGTVWLVQQTGLQTPLYQSNSYSTVGGSNGTTYSANVATMFRTFVFPTQSSTYSINEIGYSDNGTLSLCNGRIVLGSTITVGTSNFPVIEIEMVYTASPSSPISVSNVGTNFNTAGQLMLQAWESTFVASNGSTSFTQSSGTRFTTQDVLPNCGCVISFHIANDITLNSAVGTSGTANAVEAYSTAVNQNISNSGNPVGVGTSTASYSLTTNGETCYSMVFGSNYSNSGSRTNQVIVLLFTTPVVLPVGTFQGSFTFQMQFSRTLSN